MAGGGPFSSAAGGSPDTELGQFLGHVRPRPPRPQRFSQCRREQELVDKVHCAMAPNGTFQRKAPSVAPPGLSRSVIDALQHLRRRQREENLLDQNVIFFLSIHVTRCAEKRECIWKGLGKANMEPYFVSTFRSASPGAQRCRRKHYLGENKKAFSVASEGLQ